MTLFGDADQLLAELGVGDLGQFDHPLVDPLAVQFRLRVNQKEAWQAWNRGVTSLFNQAPGIGETKSYNLYFDTDVSGIGDDVVVLCFDGVSFDPNDDPNTWLFVEEVSVNEFTVTHSTDKIRYT